MLGFLILNLPSVLWDCQLDDRKGIWLAKLLRIYWYVGVGDLIGAWHVTTATSIISCCSLTFRYLLIQARLSWNTGCQSECCFCLHSEINRFYPIVMNIYIFQKKSKSLEWKLAGKFSNDERNVTKKLCLKNVSCCRNIYLKSSTGHFSWTPGTCIGFVIKVYAVDLAVLCIETRVV